MSEIDTIYDISKYDDIIISIYDKLEINKFYKTRIYSLNISILNISRKYFIPSISYEILQKFKTYINENIILLFYKTHRFRWVLYFKNI